MFRFYFALMIDVYETATCRALLVIVVDEPSLSWAHAGLPPAKSGSLRHLLCRTVEHTQNYCGQVKTVFSCPQYWKPNSFVQSCLRCEQNCKNVFSFEISCRRQSWLVANYVHTADIDKRVLSCYFCPCRRCVRRRWTTVNGALQILTTMMMIMMIMMNRT